MLFCPFIFFLLAAVRTVHIGIWLVVSKSGQNFFLRCKTQDGPYMAYPNGSKTMNIFSKIPSNKLKTSKQNHSISHILFRPSLGILKVMPSNHLSLDLQCTTRVGHETIKSRGESEMPEDIQRCINFSACAETILPSSRDPFYSSQIKSHETIPSQV